MKEFTQPLINRDHQFLGTCEDDLVCIAEIEHLFEVTDPYWNEQPITAAATDPYCYKPPITAAATDPYWNEQPITAAVTDTRPADRPALRFTLDFGMGGMVCGVSIDENEIMTTAALDDWFDTYFPDYDGYLYVSLQVGGKWLALKARE